MSPAGRVRKLQGSCKEADCAVLCCAVGGCWPVFSWASFLLPAGPCSCPRWRFPVRAIRVTPDASLPWAQPTPPLSRPPPFVCADDDPLRLLPCDTCDCQLHTYCLQPPLEEAPLQTVGGPLHSLHLMAAAHPNASLQGLLWCAGAACTPACLLVCVSHPCACKETCDAYAATALVWSPSPPSHQ